MNQFLQAYYLPRISIIFLGILFVLLLFVTDTSNAQVNLPPDSTGFHFWYSSHDARSTAMANATVADPLTINEFNSNPASLPFNPRLPDITTHSIYNASRNVLIENITGSIKMRQNRYLSIGVTFQQSGLSFSPLVNTNQLSFSEYSLDLAYTQLVSPTFSFGAKVSSTYGTTEQNDAWTANASLGLFYAPTSSISYGIIYKGTGYQTDWLGSGLQYSRLVGSEHTDVITAERPHRLELGATLRFPSLSNYPDFVLSFTNEKLFNMPGLVYRGGIELYLIESIALRGGYFHSSYIQGGRVGLGLHFNPISIDYAYAPTNLELTGQTHQLSISANF